MIDIEFTAYVHTITDNLRDKVLVSTHNIKLDNPTLQEKVRGFHDFLLGCGYQTESIISCMELLIEEENSDD